VLSLRAPGLGFVMITLALGRSCGASLSANNAHRRRHGIRHPARPMPLGIDINNGATFSILHADRVRDPPVLHLAILPLAFGAA